MASDTRVRVWTFLVYPESAFQDWENILNEQHIEFAVSPLHDKDICPTGEPKKPHYHILLSFDGKKSYDQILEITKSVNGTIPQRVQNQRSMIRYFAHLDNPDKAQYPISEVRCFGGLDIFDLLKPNSGLRHQFISEMISFIKEYCIFEIADLIDYINENDKEDWRSCLYDNSLYVIEKYIKSNRARFYSAPRKDISNE